MKTNIVGTPKGIGKEALHIADVSQQSKLLKSFVDYAKDRSINDININYDTIHYFLEDSNYTQQKDKTLINQYYIMSEIIKTLELIRTSISKNIDIAKPYSNSVVLDNFRDDLKDIDRLICNLNLANEDNTSNEQALNIDLVSKCKNLPEGEIAISSKALTDPNWKS